MNVPCHVRLLSAHTSSSFSILSTINLGRGWEPTVKYVEIGTGILPASSWATASLFSDMSSENRLPVMRAREKFCFVCKVDSLVNAFCNWPLMSPRTMLCWSQTMKPGVRGLDIHLGRIHHGKAYANECGMKEVAIL